MNRTPSEIVSAVVDAIVKRHRFLVVTHVRPDGDAAGSLLAMTFILRKLGKEADPFCEDPLPTGHDFLKGAGMIRHEAFDPSPYDAAVIVDCGDFQRVGSRLAEIVGRIPMLINIDHHVTNSPFGHVRWIETSASSTCEMLFDLADSLSVTLDPDIAAQLYTGILTDTGSFRFANTNHRVLEIAAKLVAAGVKPAFVAQNIYDSAPPQRLRLLAQVLPTVRFFLDDRLATAELTQKMFNDTGTSFVDSDSFINELRSVKPVEMAMLFREGNDGLIYVSMRSKERVDVATFARRHGGGGHRLAAAFRVPGAMEAVRSAITGEALSYIS